MAAEQDLEVEDDLARGMNTPTQYIFFKDKLKRHHQRKNVYETSKLVSQRSQRRTLSSSVMSVTLIKGLLS
jgi:hypothetical protein